MSTEDPVEAGHDTTPPPAELQRERQARPRALPDVDVPVEVAAVLLDWINDTEPSEQVGRINALARWVRAEGLTEHPIAAVQWVPIERVQANDYNPNAVAHHEMRLLHTSIASDGYTQPVVTVFDPEIDRYVIVDGFHRYTVMRKYADTYGTTDGHLPIVVIDKPIADRIASTVRHNRARGKHSVAGMSSLVFQMLEAGETDETICNKLGLEAEELARLKHITGYSKLYAEHEYSPVHLTTTQLREKAAYKAEHPDETVPRF